ncbi:hypothetical protein LINGRAHAP2_LOCUS30170 [Linum grandiflorum]
MTLLQSWIYEYFPSLRRADSPGCWGSACREVGWSLARWTEWGAGAAEVVHVACSVGSLDTHTCPVASVREQSSQRRC